MLTRLVTVERREVAAVAWSFACFFFLLSGYYVLRPVRDEMAVQSGVANLPWLFTAIFVAMTAAVPAFGWLASRYPRRVLLPAVYLFFILNLACFRAAFGFEVAHVWVARAFFVWVGVFNLFAVSVFWSFLVDVFDEAQGKRLFGFIAAGGTSGAILGPALAAGLARLLGPVDLLPVSALLLLAAVVCLQRLGRWSRTASAAANGGGAALGGGIWAGLTGVLRSPYLIGICFYLFCYTMTSTLIYVEVLRLVPADFPDPAERTRLFAVIDLTVNALALAAQVLVTAKAFERLGMTLTLALMPAFAAAGFLAVGIAPLLPALIAFGIIRRAGEFALSKPAREVLFTVLPREAKYKCKNVIDTLVYRGGDALSSTLATALRGLGLGLSALSLLAVPLAVAWLAVALWLGREQQKLRAC